MDVPPIEVKAIAIPQVTLPGEYVGSGFASVGLGKCAARIDGATSGFTIDGSPGTGADALLRVVLSRSKDLFVEINDDRLVAGVGGWTTGDHLEIWSAPSGTCADPTGVPSVSQWAIRVADGRVFPGYGQPTRLLSVESTRGNYGVRMKIRLAEVIGTNDRLTLVYGDSDDGIRTKRRIATSELDSRNWWTLGETFDPFAKVYGPTPDVGCAIESGKLSPRVPAVPLPAD
jgi:hypothetical protein